jgi:hypothetical protein
MSFVKAPAPAVPQGPGGASDNSPALSSAGEMQQASTRPVGTAEPKFKSAARHWRKPVMNGFDVPRFSAVSSQSFSPKSLCASSQEIRSNGSEFSQEQRASHATQHCGKCWISRSFLQDRQDAITADSRFILTAGSSNQR